MTRYWSHDDDFTTRRDLSQGRVRVTAYHSFVCIKASPIFTLISLKKKTCFVSSALNDSRVALSRGVRWVCIVSCMYSLQYVMYIQPGKKRRLSTIKAGVYCNSRVFLGLKSSDMKPKQRRRKTARIFCHLCGMKPLNTIHYLLLWEVQCFPPWQEIFHVDFLDEKRG